MSALGICPHCESEHVEPTNVIDRFRCLDCGAIWRGVRRRLAA